MNILIVQQLAWGLRIGHEMAKMFGADDHALSALVYGAEVRAHIERQKDVSYKDLLFVDPLYDAGADRVSVDQIREIEDRYGLDSIWRPIYADRLLVYSFVSSRHFIPRKPVSNDYLLSVCWRTYCAIRAHLDRARPDLVLAPVVGCLANYLLFLEARVRGIPCFTIGATRFDQNLFVADDLFLGSASIVERFEELREDPSSSAMYDKAQTIYQRLRRKDGDTRPTYIRRPERWSWSSRAMRATARDSLLLLPRVVRALLWPRRVVAFENIWLPSESRWQAARNLLVQFRERFVATDAQGMCHRDLAGFDAPYVYFPLHVEPELTLLVFAPEYSNQLEVCRRIALALPSGVRLLVKEHPAMVASRSRGFYEALRGLVNVELVHSSVPSFDVFSHPRCEAVAVISSSVGFEAAMNGKAVVMFGRGDYASLPAVHRAASLDEAILRLREICVGNLRSDAVDVDRPNLAYLCAQLEESFSFDYFERWTTGGGRIDARTAVQAVYRKLQRS